MIALDHVIRLAAALHAESREPPAEAVICVDDAVERNELPA